MKSIRKIAAVVLVAIMVLSMLPVSLAADAPTTGTITINNAVAGKTYTVYQLLGAALDTENPKGDGTYPISYYIDAKISNGGSDGSKVDNPVYILLTTNNTLMEDFVLKPTTTEGRYTVTYKYDKTTNLSAADVSAFMSLTDTQLALLTKKTSNEATKDKLIINELDFGYYMIKSTGDDGEAVATINSTNPNASVNLKDTRKPSNPDKVENKTEVYDGASVTYNASVKAVNYVTSTDQSGNTTTNQVLNYSLTDIPDVTNNAPGNDAAWVKLKWVRVYDAEYLEDHGYLDDKGNIRVDSTTGLYNLPTDHYQTVSAYNTAVSHYAKGDDDKWKVTWDNINDYGYYNAVNADTGTEDWYTLRIPWAKPVGDKYESLYYPVSYIVAEYEQFIGKDINEVVGDKFDGTYTNKVDYKYDTKYSSDIEIGTDQVSAYVTGISLRKHPVGAKDDDDVLTGAKYIAYKTGTVSGITGTVYYSYHEYTDEQYEDEVKKAQEKYIKTVSGATISTYADSKADSIPTRAQIDAYMNEHPVSHTAWIQETGTVNVNDYTTFTNATVLTADNNYSTVEIKNLYDDEFYLQEVEAPFGYTCPTDPYLVTVHPTKDMTNSQKHFTVTIEKKSTGLPEATIGENANNFYTAQLYDGTASTLPTTGGTGTLAFIVIGTLAFLAGCVILVTKKRMYNEG